MDTELDLETGERYIVTECPTCGERYDATQVNHEHGQPFMAERDSERPEVVIIGGFSVEIRGKGWPVVIYGRDRQAYWSETRERFLTPTECIFCGAESAVAEPHAADCSAPARWRNRTRRHS